jgi:hypothetical protein
VRGRKGLHARAHNLQYSDRYDCVISADEGGFIEYWQPSEPFELPNNVRGLWQFKAQTDLYEFKKVIKFALSYIFFSHHL